MTDKIIHFDNVKYHYPQHDDNIIFDGLTLSLDCGITSLCGQNGTGKSTFFLLSSGMALPVDGRVTIYDKDTSLIKDDIKAKQELVSYAFQNMEFETDDKTGDLLNYVYSEGFHSNKDGRLVDDIKKHLNLNNLLNKSVNILSKGEMQRVIVAFSLLYGSKIIMLDEPVFALEDRDKTAVFDFVTDYVRRSGLSLLYSAHELELTRKYSDKMLLFYKNGKVVHDTTESLFTTKNLEDAYEVPYAMLKQKETLYRETLSV